MKILCVCVEELHEGDYAHTYYKDIPTYKRLKDTFVYPEMLKENHKDVREALVNIKECDIFIVSGKYSKLRFEWVDVH